MKKFGGTNVARRDTLLQSALKNGSGPRNELQMAWDSLGKAKSMLHQVDHKMMDLSKPSSADILWHLPDFLYCLVDQENLKDLPNSHRNDLLGNSVSASPVKRKVSYKESRTDSDSLYNSVSDRKHSSAVIPTDGSSLPTSGENTFARNIPDMSSISALSSDVQPQSSAWNSSSRDVTADVTSLTAVRDTDIRFLNDVTVQPKSSMPRETAKPPRFHHVDVVIPAGYGKKTTNGVGRRVTIQEPSDDVRHTEALQEAERDVAPNAKFTSEMGQMRLDDCSDGTLDGAGILRKVANGPPAPTHKGFNEPQSRFRASPVKARWVEQQSDLKDKDGPATQTQNAEMVSEYPFLSTAESAKKRGRVTGTGNSEVAKKEIITTNSWRAGAKLTHDLGLTFILPSKSEAVGKADVAKESKKIKDQGFVEDASLSDVAKKILRDLQPEKESTEYNKKTPRKKLFKKKPMPSPDEIPKEKPTKVVLYDANEARKFIRKQKEQRRKDRLLKKESEMKMKTERQQRLEDLGKRQHEAAVKSMRKNSANVMNSTWDNGMTANNDAQLSEDDEDDDDDSSEEHSKDSDILDNANRSVRKTRPETKQSERPMVYDQKRVVYEELENRIHGPASDGDDLTAQEIVNRFAIRSGLTLEDVVTNYAKYADEIMRSFIAKDDYGNRSKGSKQKEVEGSASQPKPSSVSSRLEAILQSSKSLQSRLHTESQRFTADPVMSSGANVRSAPRTPRDYISNFETTNSSTSVVFGSDLPGYNHRPAADSPTLKQSHHGMFTSGFVYHVQQGDLTVEQQEAMFKKELSTCKSKEESCPFYLRPPLGQLTNKMDSPLLIAAKLVPSWNPSVTEADPLNILNIFSRRQKGILMMNEKDSKISRNPSKQKLDLASGTKALEMVTEKDPLTSYLSSPSVGRKGIVDEGALSLIPERDTSVRDLRKNQETSSNVGKRNLPAVRPTERVQVERIQIEVGDDNSDDASSVPPVFSQRSDPWPVTQRSEVMTNRSDGVSYTMDFTDAGNMTDEENNPSGDHLGDRSVDQSFDHSVDRSAEHSGGWSGSKGGNKDREGDDEEMALATNSDISSLTASDPHKEDDSDFSNVTSVTLDSALLTQQSKALSQIHDSLPLIGATLANPVLAPVALEARMLAELNLLDNLDEVLLQVSGMERARSVALAQQETVALAQVLKARQQSQNQEVEAARVKLEKENVEESRRLQLRLAETQDREHNTAVTRIQATADAISSLQDAMHRLSQTQADAAQMTAEAAMKLAEASAIALEKQQDRPEMGQLLTESATAAASAAVIAVMQQLKSKQRTASERESKTSISSESPRKSSKQSRRPVSARSDRSAKSVTSGSYRTAASSSVQASDYESESDATTTVHTKRSRKSSSIMTEPRFVVGMDLSRPGSVQSVAADSDIQTASDMSKVSRKSRMTVATDMSEHTKSVVTASDVSSDENTVEASSITTELSVRRKRSNGSRTSKATELVQSEKDYASDYDDSVTEDELEKSLREIVPSEGQRKKLKKNELKLNFSSESDRTSTNGQKQSPDNNSFDRFNVAMVQQYLKEEAVRHQHKQTLLQLREKALKEKTAAELAWLEQQKQTLKKKGLDDKYPELSKKQEAILRRHKKYQGELNRLKAANQMTLEAQKLLLSETHGINKLQKSVQQVKQRLKTAGAEGTLPDLDVTTDDDDASISLVLPKDEVDAPGKGDNVKSYHEDYETNETLKKSDKKRLIEHEERLQRKLTRFEKLLQDSPKQHKKDFELKHNQRISGKKKVSPRPLPLDSARSVATASDALASVRTETGRSNRLGSASEDLATDRSFSARNARSSDASIKEELSTARSVNTARSSSQASSADVKEDISEAGNKSGSSDESVKSITEQLSRRNSAASRAQQKRSGRVIQSQEVKKKSVSEDKRDETEKDSVVSGSDEEFTLSQSVDVSDRSEVEGRIENLTKELKRRKKEAEQLKKRQEKKRLKLEEEKLRQKLKDYESFIKEAKKDLQSPTSATEEQKKQREDISHHTSTSSDSSINHSTIVVDDSSKKLRNSELQPSSGSKRLSGNGKDSVDHSEANTRRSSVSEDVVEEDFSLATPSAGGEKVLLDLDLGGFDDQNQGSTTPRTARSEARIPESARSLADIPEDYSLQDDLNRSEQSASQAEPSERVHSKSSQNPASDVANSYTEDFSDNSTSLDDGSEKKSNEKSTKLNMDDGKTGLAAKLSQSEGKMDSEEEKESTEDDISEELDSQVDSGEDEQMEEMKIVKDDLLISDVDMGLKGSTESGKDIDPSATEPIVSDKEAKKVKCEEVTKATLDTLLKETIDDIIRIRKQKANSVITKDETVLSLEQSPQKAAPYSAANEKEDFLDDKYSFDDGGDWEISTKLENDTTIYEPLPVTMEQVATVVPHNKEEVLAMIDSAVDLLWNNQSAQQKSWHNLKNDVATRNRSDDVTAAQSKASYSRLVFDLTAEALCTIYMDESTAEKLPWCLPEVAKGTRHYVKPFGVTAEHVKPTVQERVLRWIGLDDQNSRRPRPVKKFRRRRGCQATKSDQLDELVLEDLNEEEAGWVDYSQDELNIKMELADSIFDSMLRETVSLLATVKSKKPD